MFSSYDVSERFATVTDGDGAFRVEYYLPACPCFTYMYDGDLWAEIPYKNYNPLNSEQLPFASFFASTPTSDVCSRYHYCPRVPASQKAEIAAICRVQVSDRTISQIICRVRHEAPIYPQLKVLPEKW